MGGGVYTLTGTATGLPPNPKVYNILTNNIINLNKIQCTILPRIAASTAERGIKRISG